eukprot:9015817-Alexandrium_andersonii.AAC.1
MAAPSCNIFSGKTSQRGTHLWMAWRPVFRMALRVGATYADRLGSNTRVCKSRDGNQPTQRARP